MVIGGERKSNCKVDKVTSGGGEKVEIEQGRPMHRRQLKSVGVHGQRTGIAEVDCVFSSTIVRKIWPNKMIILNSRINMSSKCGNGKEITPIP
ncbi:hypothetical protein T4D_2342 [Trichinella pseudospiralis]|uniref:Uncharacterized protein n=1 Tax=Trichinella pseudospiralis TaxID=6337 RepID=A0A0V1FI61_TRIPS|nr:hypothetical protein T4D_2342 [Trichinella pseudospiralis]